MARKTEKQKYLQGFIDTMHNYLNHLRSKNLGACDIAGKACSPKNKEEEEGEKLENFKI